MIYSLNSLKIAIIISVILIASFSCGFALAETGPCQLLSPADSQKVNNYGGVVKWCPNKECMVNVKDYYSALGYDYVPGSDICLYNCDIVEGYTMWKSSSYEYVTIIYDNAGSGSYISEGCSSEGAVRDNMLSWFLYILTGMFCAWAFVVAVQTVNS